MVHTEGIDMQLCAHKEVLQQDPDYIKLSTLQMGIITNFLSLILFRNNMYISGY